MPGAPVCEATLGSLQSEGDGRPAAPGAPVTQVGHEIDILGQIFRSEARALRKRRFVSGHTALQNCRPVCVLNKVSGA